MEIPSSDLDGFLVAFRTTSGQEGMELHSFIGDEITAGSKVDQEIRNILRSAKKAINEVLKQEKLLTGVATDMEDFAKTGKFQIKVKQ